MNTKDKPSSVYISRVWQVYAEVFGEDPEPHIKIRLSNTVDMFYAFDIPSTMAGQLLAVYGSKLQVDFNWQERLRLISRRDLRPWRSEKCRTR